MNIREISTSRLREYENNPRNNDLAVEKVKHSIERFGFLFPVIVDVNFTIVAGHTRVRACRELGIQSVPCIIADELTDEQINLFRLVDNKTSEYSDWDFEKLKHELSLVDLTLDKNQLLIDRFELSVEVFDIEPEQAEIKIPSFNFMGVNKKPSVKTINNGVDDDEMSTDSDNRIHNSNGYDINRTSNNINIEQIEESGNGVQNNINIEEFEEPIKSVTQKEVLEGEEHQSITTQETQSEVKKESKALRAFCQFRFGDVSFFISQIELDRMNEKYTEYVDSGAILETSFVDYLLKGVESID